MIKLLWIPVAGTIAAIVAILLAREPRGDETPPPPEPPPFELPEELEPGDAPEEPMTEEPEPEPPAPETPAEMHIRLGPDGSLLAMDTGERFASVDELKEALGEARPMLFVGNADGVAEDALDNVLAQLRDRFQVRKVYRAPEPPPGEDR